MGRLSMVPLSLILVAWTGMSTAGMGTVGMSMDGTGMDGMSTVLSDGACDLRALDPAARPAAVHLVVGPLPADGDPRLVHHLEHLLVDGPTLRCARSRGAELDAYTGPDTLHLVWRGRVGEGEAARVAELLQASLQETELASWSEAASEIAVERALADRSSSERLLQDSAAPGSRHRLDLRGAVSADLAAARAELAASPVTVVTAVDREPVTWTTSLSPSSERPELRRRSRTVGVEQAWEVQGSASCEDRRAVWAALEGLAVATEGVAIGWWGHEQGILAVADSRRSLSRRATRRALQPALDYDRAAVDMTLRRSRDVGDRSWMGVGVLGLGACPALEPLSADALRQALTLLRTGGWLEPLQHGDELTLPEVEWAAVWQAGTPPADWTDRPGFHTRTPGGFTVDGPVERLGELPRAQAELASVEEHPLEQVLTVLGAREVAVPCQPSGAIQPVCGPPGQLRVPVAAAAVVVDRPGAFQVTEVRALAEGTGAEARRRFDEAPGSESIRGYRHTLEPRRSIRSWATLSAAGLVLQDRPSAPASTALEARWRARPWERAPQPRAPGRPDAAAVLDEAPVLRVFEGPADELLGILEAEGIAVDRVWLPDQLAAEAQATRASEAD